MRFPKFFERSHGVGADSHHAEERRRLARLSFLTLGVVFGDIGTSPLYAVRKSLLSIQHAVGHPPPAADVLGVLSLVIWALILVICFKYQIFVLRADNRGDGGIIALMALLRHRRPSDAGFAGTEQTRRHRRMFATGAWVVVLGVFGASLLYGDGMITPAISVLSAVEGLKVASPNLGQLVIPLTCVILFLLFWFQRRGTAGVASLFAPVIVLWFLVIGGLGLASLVKAPQILMAFNPAHAVFFFIAHKALGFIVLGSVFLAVTGGEVLYAALGHFGAKPIRAAWFVLALPMLILNYLGQGAMMLHHPGPVPNLFFSLAPPGTVPIYVLIGIATLAAIIASQASISGAFSLMSQAISLNMSPRVKVERTSRTERGQVYIPSLNAILMVACIVLVLAFRSSGNLAGAYGVAISTDMLITTFLMFFVMRRLWRWPLAGAGLLTLIFLCMDIPFWGANIIKLTQGGWVPIMVALLAFTIMRVWTKNRERLIGALRGRTESLEIFLDRLSHNMPQRVPGTAVFLTSPGLGVPPMLDYHLRHNQTLHEQVLLLSVITTDEPSVMPARRVEVVPYGYGFYRVRLYYGFKQAQPVMRSLQHAADRGLITLDPERTTFYFGRETIVPAPYGGPLFGLRRWLTECWCRWRGLPAPVRKGPARVGLRQAISERLFVLMHRNAMRATDFFSVPDDYTVEIGLRLHTTSLAAGDESSAKHSGP